MQLSIIIVNYNVKYFLEYCLLSALKACTQINAEILVVDNNSTDGSKQYLQYKFASVQFFWNNENLGFGKANNFALQFAKGEHVLFLNPDTIVPEDCFLNCLSFFKNHTNCGAAGVRMIDGSGIFLKESKRNLPTPLAGFFKLCGLNILFPSSKIFAQYYAGTLPEKQNNKVEVLAGAFMMLSKKAIEATKGFDESFFMYGEDIDLSYRITKAGLQNYYLGENTIIHFKGESTQKHTKKYVKNFYGAMKHFVSKHYNNQLLKRQLMYFVIWLGKAVANAKIVLPKKQSNTSAIQTKQSILIGGKQETAKAIIYFKKNNINTSLLLIENKNLNAREVIQFAENENSNIIVFCNGILTNKIIIEIVAALPNKFEIAFFDQTADCIISSSNKNTNGVVILNNQ